MSHNAQISALVRHVTIPLDAEFPLRVVVEGSRDGEPIDALHAHDVLELGLCTTGSGTFYVGPKILPFRAGDVTVLTPLEWHRCRSTPGTRSAWHWFFFDPARLLAPLGPAHLTYNPRWYAGPGFTNVLTPDQAPTLAPILRDAAAEFQGRSPCRQTSIRALLLLLLNRLHDRVRPDTLPPLDEGSVLTPPAPLPIVAALDAITQHPQRAWRIEELADRCCMSLRNFQLQFQRIMQTTPRAYLRQCRLQTAAALLRSTDLPIAQVARRSGFSTSSSFHRAFRQEFAQSPLAFRRNNAPDATGRTPAQKLLPPTPIPEYA